jgi:hypothetical protein
MATNQSPARRLYRLLVDFYSEAIIPRYFLHDDDFQSMVGPFEARFCEWIYHQREHGRLAKRLHDICVRQVEIDYLADKVGLDIENIESLPPTTQLGIVLDALDCGDPKPPPRIHTGVFQLRRLARAFQHDYKPGQTDIEGCDISPEGLVPSARRGAERLLKLLVRFLWDAGFADSLRRVVDEGAHGFQKGLAKTSDDPSWFEHFTLAPLNFLLQAFDAERRERGLELPFMRRGDDIFWHKDAFAAFGKLAKALNKEVHEGMALEERRALQKAALQMVTEVFDTGKMRIPQPVQFFRRFSDGYAEHYAGYTYADPFGDEETESERIFFYETNTAFELHRPYLFLAATNPSAVDAACVDLPEALTRPV